RVAVRPRPAPHGGAARRARPAPPPRTDRRNLGAVRQLRPPVPLGVNPTVDALRATFGNAIGRGLESCGDTIVYIAREALLDAMTWLRDAPQQGYDYLVDVTAVEYRDRERALDLVYQLRSLTRRADQVRQALAANPEAHYSMEELSIAAAYDELPADMRERLRRGERGKLPDSE